MRRRRVLIGLYSDIFLRNFVETGAFDRLGDRFDVAWFAADTVKGALPEDRGFHDAGRAVTSPRRDAIRYQMRWVAVFAGHRRARTLAIKRRYIDFSLPARLAYAGLALPGVWPAVDALVEAALGLNRSMAEIVERVRPDVVVFPSQGNDSFAVDLLRVARRQRIPTVMLNYNWDNMTSKGAMRIRPDRLCVWGMDMAAAVERIHRLRPEQVKVIGAAHFQQYFDPVRIARAAAEARTLGGPPQVLFAGNSRGHPEMKYLRVLDTAIEDGRLPPLRIIFRPHPWRAPRGEPEFHEMGFRHVEMDSQLAPQFARGMNAPHRGPDRTFAPSMSYNLQLLHRVRGVITPMSTLALEAALVGVPVLAVDFFQERWLRYALDNFEHLQRMRAAVPGVCICRDESRLIDDVGGLLALAEDPTLPARMGEAVRPIVHDDGRSYAERLIEVIDELLASPAASTQRMAVEEIAAAGRG